MKKRAKRTVSVVGVPGGWAVRLNVNGKDEAAWIGAGGGTDMPCLLGGTIMPRPVTKAKAEARAEAWCNAVGDRLVDDERGPTTVLTRHGFVDTTGWTDDERMTLKARAFLEEVEALCRKHSLAITHEDHEGAFMVVPFSAIDADRLRQATWWSGKPKRCGRPVEGETCIMTPGHGPPCRRRRLR